MSRKAAQKAREASPDPMVGIVRSFSDEISAQDLNPDDLTKALSVKVGSDRRAEAHVATVQREWQRLFHDAGSLAYDFIDEPLGDRR